MGLSTAMDYITFNANGQAIEQIGFDGVSTFTDYDPIDGVGRSGELDGQRGQRHLHARCGFDAGVARVAADNGCGRSRGRYG